MYLESMIPFLSVSIMNGSDDRSKLSKSFEAKAGSEAMISSTLTRKTFILFFCFRSSCEMIFRAAAIYAAQMLQPSVWNMIRFDSPFSFRRFMVFFVDLA